MSRWNDHATVADSLTFTAGTPETADISELRDPVALVNLESLGGNADDTITIRVVGAAATYDVDSRTLSATGSYSVDIPQAGSVEVESANGTTISAEVRADPR